MKNAILTFAVLCAVGMLVGCKSGTATETKQASSECVLDRPEHLPDEEWELVSANCEYFKALIDAGKQLQLGEALSASKVQELMPKNEKDFGLFCIYTMAYGEKTNNTDLCMLATQYAIADSLDIMEHVLMWSVWSDSWELPWEVAIDMENKNHEKFWTIVRRIWNEDEIAAWEEYRQAYIEWNLDSSTPNDMLIHKRSNQ